MKLTKDTSPIEWDGGTVRYIVHDATGRFVGYIGDGRAWVGHQYGGRRWWAAYRLDGDTSARWSSDLDYTSRRSALEALKGQVVDGAIADTFGSMTVPNPDKEGLYRAVAEGIRNATPGAAWTVDDTSHVAEVGNHQIMLHAGDEPGEVAFWIFEDNDAQSYGVLTNDQDVADAVDLVNQWMAL
jgi:hypothetical protein